ncbi:MAG: hypothetical protein M3O09_02895 [Acidobacteriota bacterium]|nr:hypothetical protein [Acidobacteriota bacterium]
MRSSRFFISALSMALLIGLLHTISAKAATSQSGPVKLTLQRLGASSFASAPMATDVSGLPDEIDSAVNGGDADGGNGDVLAIGLNRSLPGTSPGKAGKALSSKPKSNPLLGTNFQGLNFHDQRFANGGNQFSVEPPDQALCAGNGFVLESVNDVLQVYNSAGIALLNGGQAVDLNTFYGYPPAIVRSGPNAGQRGPSLTDPVCLYDQAIGRFVHVVLTLDHVGLTGSLNGNNHLDIAVSNTGDPTGTWTIYKLPVQNNGTQGTPDHQCNNGFCLGDYPHIGADANGIYLTTNEFAVFGAGFYGAQIYGIGNNLLIGGSGSVVLFDTLGAGPDGAGFTVWPAQSPSNQFDTDNGGTEFFLSSNAVFSNSGTSNSILVWTMANTASLNTAFPAPTLALSTVAVNTYAVPPRAMQPAGNRPLSDCIADTVIFPTCNVVVAGTNSHNNTPFGPPNGSLNANDSRMQQVSYANGKLWGALDTAVNVGNQTRAGIAYYVINPNINALVLQGQAGIANTDLTYPAVGVTPSGRGVIAFTLTGDNDYPSAALAGLDAKVGMGAVQVAAAGAGSWDGFTSYKIFGAGRPRWGDYGAAAVDGGDIWVASEYAAQTCTYAQYLVVPRGQCGGTRGALSNWSTHVTKVTP